MENYGLKIAITAEDILNKIVPEQRDLFNKVKFTAVTRSDNCVQIECLLLNEPINDNGYMYHLFSDGHISLL